MCWDFSGSQLCVTFKLFIAQFVSPFSTVNEYAVYYLRVVLYMLSILVLKDFRLSSVYNSVRIISGFYYIVDELLDLARFYFGLTRSRKEVFDLFPQFQKISLALQQCEERSGPGGGSKR